MTAVVLLREKLKKTKSRQIITSGLTSFVSLPLKVKTKRRNVYTNYTRCVGFVKVGNNVHKLV